MSTLNPHDISAAVDDPVVALFGPARQLPDRIVIRPASGRGVAGLVLTPHPDKAISQRATILAALADGISRIGNLADCADVRTNLQALRHLGVPLRISEQADLEVTGSAGSDLRAAGLTLDAGNSATTSRLLLAVLAGSACDCVLTGNDLLRGRSLNDVLEPLRERGAEIEEMGEQGRLPVRIRGTALRGARLTGGEVTISVDSAQPVSAMQFAAIGAAGPMLIRRRTVARDHTERLLHWTGVPIRQRDADILVTPRRPRAFDLTIPGDPSGAGLLAALHVASANRHRLLTIAGVGLNPLRTGFLRILTAMGVSVIETTTDPDGPEPLGDLRIRLTGPLSGIVVEGSGLVQSAIDELPLVAALAAVADEPTVIRDAAELRGKDTDRITSTVALLHAFNADAEATPDGLLIRPGRPLRAPTGLTLPADHRVIFAAFVLTLLAGGGELTGVGAVATSHPGAIDDLARFAEVEI
jgi:3-phosphoshikimate 1-carboxyvinyltransferase